MLKYPKYKAYFLSLGYKNYDKYEDLIIKGFQQHCFPNDKEKWDGIIGPKTQAKIDFFTPCNYCPEVFEHINGYTPYNDVEIEALMQYKLVGLGATFNKFAKLNDYDVLHAICHAMLESGSGTSYIALKKNNLFGWACYDATPVESAEKYNSFAESIEFWSKKLKELYLLPAGKFYNGDSEFGINVKYATSPVAAVNKAFIAHRLRMQLISKRTRYA